MELRSLSVSGLVVALVGFGLTRFTVSLAATETRTQFFFGGLVPLVLGLTLAAAGVVLAVGRYPRSFVRTVTGWCLVGVAVMSALVVLTILGSDPGALMNPKALQGETILSNFLIAGACRRGTHRRLRRPEQITADRTPSAGKPPRVAQPAAP
ncbi:MAG: hypothetical protein V5A55_09750 [Halovenus sp.]